MRSILRIWCLIVMVCMIGSAGMINTVLADENKGSIILDLTPEIQAEVMQQSNQAPQSQPMLISVVKITDKSGMHYWEANVTSLQDLSISATSGKYKVYVHVQGSKTTYEFDNNGAGYLVSSDTTTIIPLSVNWYGREIFGDAPWRNELAKVPILVMVKDADGLFDVDIGDICIYHDLDQDEDNDDDENGEDRLLVEKSEDVTIQNAQYNLYYNGDWYDIIELDVSGNYLDGDEEPYTLTGEVHLHVVFEENGELWDPDDDWHSHFMINVNAENLPTLTNWHPGDTHYHSSYTDNAVEFGFPIDATVEAGKSIGIDWNIITDHSFDVGDNRSDENYCNHKWDALKSDINFYTTDSYKLILGEEVSCYGHENSLNPLVPRGVVHFLVLGMDNFNNIGGTGLNFIPGGHDDPWCNDPTWNLEDVIEIANSRGGVCYAAHPEGHRGDDALLLDRVPWITEDYELVGYNGLEVWNEKYTQDNDWEIQRDAGLEQWIRLLNENGRKDIFIAGGSDAHGDFSHHTSATGSNDNAFAKVRTYVYTETFSNNGILNALKNGHSIMTDGPVVVFDITNETGGKAIIGDEINGNQLSMDIEWKSTPEFGNIDHIYIQRGIIGENETELTELSFSPDDLEGTRIFNINSHLPLEKDSYIRINATTDKGYGAYTNPIWVHKNAPEDEFGYTFKDSKTQDGPAYDWIEISGTGKEVLPDNDDGWVGNIDLGFFFNYYGTDYSQLAISNNGLIFSGGTTWEYVNEPIKQSPSVHGFITPFWDDIVTFNPKGAIYYQTFGTAPNRMFVVEWYENNHYWDSDSGVTFEAMLYEGSNNIQFQYKDVDFGNVNWAVDGDDPPYNNGGSATVGIECPSGDDGLQYSFNAPIIDPALAILFKFPQFAGTNLYLSKQAPASKDRGSTMTYTLHYHNFGDTAAQNVVLEDTLPAEVGFLSASDDGSYDPDTGKITWNIGSLGQEGHGYVTTTVRILQDAAIGTMIQNDAIISTSNLEVRYDDNEAHALTTVTGSNLPPDVGVEPNNGGIGTPSVNWHDPVTFSYHSCDSATGVDVRIHVNDGEPDITGSMVGGPPDWTYTTMFYPRHGRAQVTYTVYGCNEETVSFDIYIDPAGYIYNAETGERIAGARVWLQRPDGEGGWVNVPTGEYPAIMQPDVNPQTTGEDGEYQWDVLEGSYRVHVEADGYYPADSIVVSIPPPVTDLHVGLTRLPDEIPPVITNVGVSPNANSAVITWETDEASDSLVMCGISSGYYPTTNSDSEMVVSHSITLTGLDPDTLYCYVVCSTDSQGNSVETTELTFRTLLETTPTPESIPEFPTIALPVIIVIGLLFIFERKIDMF